MFDVVTIDGGPRKRGAQHGEAVRDEIIANCEVTYERLAVVGVERAGIPERRRPLDLALERHAPRLREEMAGIAAGAGLALDDILTLNAYPDLGIGPSQCST